jgi:hypothetical protein
LSLWFWCDFLYSGRRHFRIRRSRFVRIDWRKHFRF